MHIEICGFIILSVSSLIFRPATLIFNEHRPEDCYNRWTKHFGGNVNYDIIHLHICIWIYVLFFIRY